MIAHFSMPAAHPRATADVFARIMDAHVMPFPPCPGAWMVIAKDGSGIGIELLPETTTLLPGEGEEAPAAFGHDQPPARPGAIHFAITTKLPVEEIIALGKAQGWRSLHADRGPFDLVELWVDNRIMVEVLAPEGTARYVAGAAPEALAMRMAHAAA